MEERDVFKINDDDDNYFNNIIIFQNTNLMQSFGYVVQSTVQRNRSHDNQPMGGVLMRPLSSAEMHLSSDNVNKTDPLPNKCILFLQKITFSFKQQIKNNHVIELILFDVHMNGPKTNLKHSNEDQHSSERYMYKPLFIFPGNLIGCLNTTSGRSVVQ